MKQILFQIFLLGIGYLNCCDLQSDEYRFPIGYYIIKSNNIEEIRKAIDRGRGVNTTYDDNFWYKGYTPLIVAIHLNYLDVKLF